MKIARSAHWIRVALPLIVFASGSIREALADQGTEACEYLTVVVDPSIADEAAPGHEIAEPMRQKILEMAAEEFSALGLILVRDRKDAYWILTASRLVGPRSVGVFIELTGSIELQHHLYIAELDRDGFPYRGEAGGNHYVGILSNSAPEHYRSEVARAARLLWGLESEQVAALCAMSAKLKEEGWVGIKELRIELLEELKRVRRARAERNLHLELEVEDALHPEASE